MLTDLQCRKAKNALVPVRGRRQAELTLPTAIIHGRAGRLLECQASIELACLIPDAEVLYPGMGHVVVAPSWEEFATIVRHTADRGDQAIDPWPLPAVAICGR